MKWSYKKIETPHNYLLIFISFILIKIEKPHIHSYHNSFIKSRFPPFYKKIENITCYYYNYYNNKNE